MGFGYLTKDAYSRIVTVPFSLPQTRLRAGTSVIVASVRCNLGSTLRLHVLNFHVTQLLTALTEEETTTRSSSGTLSTQTGITPFTYASHAQSPTPQDDYSLAIDGLGLGYVGVYASDFSAIRQPTGTPLVITVAPTIGIYALNPHNRYDFSGPDVYHVVATNNTNNLDLGIVVTGAFRLFNTIQSSYASTLDGTLVPVSNACICCNVSGVSFTPNSASVGDPVNILPVGGVTTWSSAAQTASCPTGLDGTQITVLSGAAISTISQADADAQALALATAQLVCNGPGTPAANQITATGVAPGATLTTPTELADNTAAGICNDVLP